MTSDHLPGFDGGTAPGKVEASDEHLPVIPTILAFTGISWLGDKLLGWGQKRANEGIFRKLFRAALTVTGVLLLARWLSSKGHPAELSKPGKGSFPEVVAPEHDPRFLAQEEGESAPTMV